MFTGIVQGTGQLVAVTDKTDFRTHVVRFPAELLGQLELGASVAHNGCCLTVTKVDGQEVHFDLIKETLQVTNLGALAVGDWVNLERAARFGDEIGGHAMSGHIHCTAELVDIIQSPDNRTLRFALPEPWRKYVLTKGYIGVDGISLTVGKVAEGCFEVNLIPETLARTTLGQKTLGAAINIEIDPQTQAIVDTVERVLANR
ncbi:riboflavin synthase [Gallaecimonas xiamenensis]|uniref:Riboflavin synthase n=1 Tax=Gallaecimonas xiamenensis 3-C-1 TaxID=745411 RepID=K2JTN5_9GAMM|nr:riboflavin synthase [Gallaecimonas xiamenensis]EKE77892.1 riboflavin synthase subunit alpha [Gallaecimonas xiamenensis 3-C-1]